MKISFKTLLIIYLFSGQIHSSLAQNIEENVFCDKTVRIGIKDICLPEVDGMKECYSIPIVKSKADKFEFEGNTILGFYINNNTYSQIDNFDELTLDEYFKIYFVDNLKDRDIGQSELNEMASIIENNFIKENWNKLKKEIESNHKYISIGRPVLIESYSPSDEARTYLMLGKLESYGTEYIMLMSMNLIIIKDRLIWLGYYKTYDGEESIRITKSKNDYITLLLIEENK